MFCLVILSVHWVESKTQQKHCETACNIHIGSIGFFHDHLMIYINKTLIKVSQNLCLKNMPTWETWIIFLNWLDFLSFSSILPFATQNQCIWQNKNGKFSQNMILLGYLRKRKHNKRLLHSQNMAKYWIFPWRPCSIVS